MVRRYIAQTVTDLKYLEDNIFEIKSDGVTINVEYKVAELSNDMKMLCFLAGELSNSAHYFSTFENVNKTNCSSIDKKIGGGSVTGSHIHLKKELKIVQKLNASVKNCQSQITQSYTEIQINIVCRIL